MHSRADLTLYDSSGRLTAAAEIKNKLGTTSEWAAKTRRNLLTHTGFSGVDFFLLVTPDRLYVWKEAGPNPIEVPPTYQVDAEPIFGPYFKQAGIGPDQVSSHAFELVVTTWLDDIIRSSGTDDENVDHESWFAKSGFRSAVKNSRVEYEDVA